jgi:hypothetical protein
VLGHFEVLHDDDVDDVPTNYDVTDITDFYGFLRICFYGFDDLRSAGMESGRRRLGQPSPGVADATFSGEWWCCVTTAGEVLASTASDVDVFGERCGIGFSVFVLDRLSTGCFEVHMYWLYV